MRVLTWPRPQPRQPPSSRAPLGGPRDPALAPVPGPEGFACFCSCSGCGTGPGGGRWVPAGCQGALPTIPELRGARVCAISLGKLRKREPGWLPGAGPAGWRHGAPGGPGAPGAVPRTEEQASQWAPGHTELGGCEGRGGCCHPQAPDMLLLSPSSLRPGCQASLRLLRITSPSLSPCVAHATQIYPAAGGGRVLGRRQLPVLLPGSPARRAYPLSPLGSCFGGLLAAPSPANLWALAPAARLPSRVHGTHHLPF